MANTTNEQRTAIERLQSQLDDVSPEEREKRMKAALSVSRQEVDASLAEKRGKQKPASPSS